MRCKIHPSDSGAGVCAACLRERLSALSAAVAAAGDADFSPELRRNLGRSSAPSSFGLRPADRPHSADGRSKHSRRFSFLSFLSTHSDADKPSRSGSGSGSGSWLSSMIRKRRKKKRAPTGRGMSPAERESESTDGDSEGGYQTDPLPARNSGGRRRRRGGRLRGFSMCFRPLMRPSPGERKMNQAPSEVGFSGELRGGFNAQRNRHGGAPAGGSSVLGPNRSRKIADFGKFR